MISSGTSLGTDSSSLGLATPQAVFQTVRTGLAHIEHYGTQAEELPKRGFVTP